MKFGRPQPSDDTGIISLTVTFFQLKDQDMPVNVHIHITHRQFTNGLEVVPVEGKSVGECLNHLAKQFPGMEKALFAKKDKLLNVIEIFVNHTSAYPNELARPVKDGDDIHLVVMLAGG